MVPSGDLGGKRGFVVGGRGKADRERVQFTGNLVADLPGDQRAVDATAVEAAQGHVADQPPPYGLVELLTEAAAVRAGGKHFPQRLGLVPVAGNLRRRPVSADAQEMPGGQLADAPEHGVGLEYLAKRQVLRQRIGGHLGLRAEAVADQCLDLRGEGQGVAGLQVVQRLDPEAVADQGQAAVGRVPEREGEHAVDLADPAGRGALGELQQHLGIAVGTKDVAVGGQAVTDSGEIEELAVVGNGAPGLPVGHRLRTAFEVDDRQPAVAQTHVAVDEHPGTVRAPVRQTVVHGLDQPAIHRPRTVKVVDPGYAAHGPNRGVLCCPVRPAPAVTRLTVVRR